MNKEIKVRKRREAEERQGTYDALSPWEKEEILFSRPGESIKELARIRENKKKVFPLA